nr:maestro heat-like repeat-containing protein family member 2B [Caretta caretta]
MGEFDFLNHGMLLQEGGCTFLLIAAVLCLSFPRLSIEALDSVLFKGVNERLVRALRKQRTWILLENPKTHHEGVCLLVSLLLRSGLITPEIIQSLLPWVNSPTENHRVTSTAFLARVKKHKKFLLDILIRALNDTFSSEVIGESMKALAKVLKELTEKDIASSFRDLTPQIWTCFDNECRATFHLCAPFLGLKRLQAAVNEHLGGTAELKPEGLQVDICRHLVSEL